ncbi:MAG TPA: hypothetical protein VF079_10700 [Sphingomicrobium sp.]
MATDEVAIRKIGVLRLSLTGAIVAGLFYALCWVGRLVLPIGPASHMYLQLFTSADLSSGMALAQGLCWSVVFGLLIGALGAFVYNWLGALERK